MEALFHLIVPTLTAITAGLDRKKVLALAPLAVLPDLDHALAYRALFHSIFFLVLVAGAVYAIKKDEKSALLAAFFIGSHLLFDVGGGMAVLYPLDDHYYTLQASLVGKAPRFEFLLLRSESETWRAALYEKLSTTERVWASTEMMLMAPILILGAAVLASRARAMGVSTHNPESRLSHQALRHHPPGRSGPGNY